jgi:hypothetical protein
MRYLCLIYIGTDPGAEATPEEQRAMGEAYGVFTKEVTERGVMLGGEALLPPMTATTVRLKDGDLLTTDGPFAETKEWLGGYYLLDCKDLDEATELAAKIPAASYGSIEIRPIMEQPAEVSAAS